MRNILNLINIYENYIHKNETKFMYSCEYFPKGNKSIRR